jgi:hypothetical protein
MDDSDGSSEPRDGGSGAAPAVEVRGLGFALSASGLRMLLDPATRGQAELVVDLSTISVEVLAAAVQDLAKRFAPDAAVGMAKDQVTVRLTEVPALRIELPAAGVRVRIDAAGLRVGPSDPSGDE